MLSIDEPNSMAEAITTPRRYSNLVRGISAGVLRMNVPRKIVRMTPMPAPMIRAVSPPTR